MATSFSFNNKIIKIPGSYSRIESGVKNPASGLDFGSLLVIDTGSGAGWGGGAGVSGESSSGKDSVYTFDNIQDFRNFSKGGLWWDLALPLFRPYGIGINGISQINFIRAAETTGSEIEYEFTGGGSNGGTIIFKSKEEGLVGNGALTGSILTKGFGAKMVAGRIDPAKFKIQFFQGTFKGVDYSGEPLDGITAELTKEILVSESIEFSNISELGNWAVNDERLNTYFSTTFTAAGTGVVTSADLTANTGYKLASGGTETYSAAAFTAALDVVKDLPVDFILADKYGADSTSAQNLELVYLVAEQMTVKPDIYIGGGVGSAGFASSISAAETLDSQYVTLVHDGLKIEKRNKTGFKQSPSIYHAAYVLGREAGLEPQVPLTFKGINIQGLVHQLSDLEVEQSLDSGVLVTRKVNNSFDIVKGVNTLQNNSFIINEDSTTPSKQLRRIIRQINKELVVLSRAQLLKQPFGVNRNTLSAEDLKNWIESYLLSITATPNSDNLIIGFQDVVVTREQDAYRVNYAIIPNSEISFIFFTGTIISI